MKMVGDIVTALLSDLLTQGSMISEKNEHGLLWIPVVKFFCLFVFLFDALCPSYQFSPILKNISVELKERNTL